MLTRRLASKIIPPLECLNLNVLSLGMHSPIPKTVYSALKDSNWYAAMAAEYQALLSNNTSDLVSPPPNTNIVSGKWIFRHKLKPDRTLERYKERWVL